MLKISVDFSIRYGMYFGGLADELDAAPFNPTDVDLDDYLAGGADTLEEEARDAREFSIVRPWLEFLIASTDQDIRDLHIPNFKKIADVVLQHPGVGAMPPDQWEHVLEYMRQKIFHLDKPMTPEEKAAVRREVTLTDESLDEFRTRLRAEGRLPDPE